MQVSISPDQENCGDSVSPWHANLSNQPHSCQTNYEACQECCAPFLLLPKDEVMVVLAVSQLRHAHTMNILTELVTTE